MNFTGELISPHQTDGVEWMLRREALANPAGGIVADEMGLGKTVMTIATMARNPMPTLVVVPKSLEAQWTDEVQRFAGVAPLVVTAKGLRLGQYTTELLSSCPVVITTYTALARAALTSPLFQVRFGRVVLDEAQYIKNSSSRVHAQARHLEAQVRWCLTGTPVCKSARDFDSLLAFLRVTTHNWSSRRAARECVLRRTKADIARTVGRMRVPPLSIELVSATFQYQEEANMYERLKMEGLVLLNIYAEVGTREAHVALMEQFLRLRQCVTHPQMVVSGMHKKVDSDELAPPLWTHGSTKIDLLRGEVSKETPSEKILVFCHWTYEMDAVEDMLMSMGRQVLRIDGSVSHDERHQAANTFQTSPLHNTLVIQIHTGGTGLNLYAATRVYINSLPWNATDELQAIGRAHRTGQTQEVKVKRLVIEDSIDTHLMAVQTKKLVTASFILGDHRIKTQLDPSLRLSDMRALLS
ncbi:putative global transactivator [Chlorella vulgaris]